MAVWVEWEEVSSMDEINPESGLVEGEFSGIGSYEGPHSGSGEGWRQPQMKRMDYYQQLGQQLRSALGGLQQQQPTMQAPLTAGFDQNWLGEALAAGSANGAKIG